MKNTLMIAAALLTLGASSAFAGETFYDRDAPAAQAPAAQQTDSQHQFAFPATSRGTVSVYSQFNGGSYTDGGAQ